MKGKDMNKLLGTVIFIALLTAGAARAEGDYFEGVSKEIRLGVDGFSTGGIVGNGPKAPVPTSRPPINAGDYYEGASRPY